MKQHQKIYLKFLDWIIEPLFTGMMTNIPGFGLFLSAILATVADVFISSNISSVIGSAIVNSILFKTIICFQQSNYPAQSSMPWLLPL